MVTTDGPEGGGGYKREGGRVPRGGGGASRGPEVGGSPSRRGMEEENPLAVVEGLRRLSPCRLGKTKRSGENPSPSGGHRRRDQWTCAGVPRHHGDLLATSRNKMATLPPGVSERWRQNHVVHPRPVGTGTIVFFFFFRSQEIIATLYGGLADATRKDSPTEVSNLTISYLLRQRVREMDLHNYAITWPTIASYLERVIGLQRDSYGV